MAKPQKIAVSQRALIARINRKMSADHKELKAGRGRQRSAVGEFYIVDKSRNCLVQTNIELTAFATKIGVLQEWEQLE